ncbi:hypothetical protein [Hydrogenophaga sp.]
MALNDEGMTLDLLARRPLHKPAVERFFRSMNERLCCSPMRPQVDREE